MQRRTFDILRWTLLIVGGVLLPWLYHRLWMPVSPTGLDKALFERGIATPGLLWMNGYLGSFFNLRHLGNLGWLVVPMLLWALWKFVRLARWQRGLVALIVLSGIVIGGSGGFNYRYALTLLPLLTIGAFLLLWHAFDHHGHTRRERMIFLVMLLLVGAWNTLLALDHRSRVKAHGPAALVRPGKQPTLRDRLDTGPKDLDAWLTQAGAAASDTILVNNLPEFYYATKRPGTYYWCGSDQLFLADGPHFLFKERSDAMVAAYLRDSLHITAVLSTRDLSAYEPRFEMFLAAYGELVAESGRGYTLHRIILKGPMP